MPVTADPRPVPTSRQARAAGAFLTDGERLYRVLPETEGQPAGMVWLEDCAHPDRFATEHRVAELVKRMRLVRPG